MVLYDIFKKEQRGVYPYKLISRKDFNNLDEVIAFCKRHKFKFQEAAITDREIKIKNSPNVIAISKPEPQDEVQEAPEPVEDAARVIEPHTTPESIPKPLVEPGKAPRKEIPEQMKSPILGAIS